MKFTKQTAGRYTTTTENGLKIEVCRIPMESSEIVWDVQIDGEGFSDAFGDVFSYANEYGDYHATKAEAIAWVVKHLAYKAEQAALAADKAVVAPLAAQLEQLAEAGLLAPAYTLAEIDRRAAVELEAKEIYTQTGEVCNTPGLFYIGTFGNHGHRLSQWLIAQGATVVKCSKYEALDNHVVAHFTLPQPAAPATVSQTITAPYFDYLQEDVSEALGNDLGGLVSVTITPTPDAWQAVIIRNADHVEPLQQQLAGELHVAFCEVTVLAEPANGMLGLCEARGVCYTYATRNGRVVPRSTRRTTPTTKGALVSALPLSGGGAAKATHAVRIGGTVYGVVVKPEAMRAWIGADPLHSTFAQHKTQGQAAVYTEAVFTPSNGQIFYTTRTAAGYQEQHDALLVPVNEPADAHGYTRTANV